MRDEGQAKRKTSVEEMKAMRKSRKVLGGATNDLSGSTAIAGQSRWSL